MGLLTTERMRRERPLNGKQEAFVRAYAENGFSNASAAARVAGYSQSGAHDAAKRLLSLPNVVAAVASAKSRVAARSTLTADYVLGNLMKIVEEGRNDAAKVSALDRLGKYLNLFVDRQEITGADGVPLLGSGADLSGVSEGRLREALVLLTPEVDKVTN